MAIFCREVKESTTHSGSRVNSHPDLMVEEVGSSRGELRMGTVKLSGTRFGKPRFRTLHRAEPFAGPIS
jgi:hypothetical protein